MYAGRPRAARPSPSRLTTGPPLPSVRVSIAPPPAGRAATCPLYPRVATFQAGAPVATLKNEVQNALDEARILILGTQVLIGFEYRAVFQERFDALAPWAQAAALASLCIMLVAYALVSLPAAYHRIAAGGHDRSHVHGFTTSVLRVALLPIALGIGVDAAVAGSRAIGDRAAMAFGGAVTLAALAGWYGF